MVTADSLTVEQLAPNAAFVPVIGNRRGVQAVSRLVVIDPGHGLSNRTPGVFDPGIVGVQNTREADLSLRYALCLEQKLGDAGIGTILTRRSNQEPCPLALRVRRAREASASLLCSIHFNGDAEAGNSPADGKVKGCEVLYRASASDGESLRIARTVAFAMSKHIRLRGAGVVDRQNLAVLHYQPSILIEVGFLDDPEDAALVLSGDFMTAAMESVAGAIAQTL